MEERSKGPIPIRGWGQHMRIAVDAMGGDFAPENIIEGVGLAVERYPKVDCFYLAGDESRLKVLVEVRLTPSQLL